MVNTELLERKIQESGKKKGHLCKVCNLSRQGFNNCKNNLAKFTYEQVRILCIELGIVDPMEEKSIFFNRDDSLNESN